MTNVEFRRAREAGHDDRIDTCPFRHEASVAALKMRETPHWHAFLTGRHIGIHYADARTCNWVARLLTVDRRYIQKCLGPAIDLGKGKVTFETAVERAFDWFTIVGSEHIAQDARPRGRAQGLCFSPTGTGYSVGHALRDYLEWSVLARSPGGHYNNLVLINCHLTRGVSHVLLEDFNASHVKDLATQIVSTPPKFGFSPMRSAARQDGLSPDDMRRRKRTFNSIISILKVAFQHAWDNGQIDSDRPWRCLKRVSVHHAPRLVFLTRTECSRLLAECSPAMRPLVLAALYTGCRIGELAQLRVDDVGEHIFGIRVPAFKRGPARYVFLPDEGMAFFLSLCEGKAPRDYLLLSERGMTWGKQHLAPFRRAAARAGLPDKFVFHGLRHTYASDLIRQGVPIEVVARQLGHADIRTVSNTYGHLAEQFREEQIRSRFSPLDPTQLREAEIRHDQIESLWQRVRAIDWRAYAPQAAFGGMRERSLLRTPRPVLEAFGE